MPKYRLSAFEYECTLLHEFIKEQERECEMLDVCQDLYSPDIFNSLKSTHMSLIESYTEELVPLENKLKEFRSTYTPNEKYWDDAPLEYLYQNFLNKNLNAILRKVEIVYENAVNEIQNSSEFITKRKSKQIASHLMRTTILGYTVEKYITHEHLKELESLPRYIQDASHAIAEKYRYFMNRIQCCPEIENKLIELERY